MFSWTTIPTNGCKPSQCPMQRWAPNFWYKEVLPPRFAKPSKERRKTSRSTRHIQRTCETRSRSLWIYNQLVNQPFLRIQAAFAVTPQVNQSGELVLLHHFFRFIHSHVLFSQQLYLVHTLDLSSDQNCCPTKYSGLGSTKTAPRAQQRPGSVKFPPCGVHLRRLSPMFVWSQPSSQFPQRQRLLPTTLCLSNILSMAWPCRWEIQQPHDANQFKIKCLAWCIDMLCTHEHVCVLDLHYLDMCGSGIHGPIMPSCIHKYECLQHTYIFISIQYDQMALPRTYSYGQINGWKERKIENRFLNL